MPLLLESQIDGVIPSASFIQMAVTDREELRVWPHVLLVDDNPDDRALAIRELRREFPGILISEAPNAQAFAQATDRGLSLPFDLVITDFQLRWSDGLAVLKAIKTEYPNTPVVMFTGTGSEEIAVAAMKAGLDDYVLKSPKHYSRVATTARSVLENSRQRLALREVETRYRSLFERLPVGLYRFGSDGRILDGNPALLRMLGCSKLEDLLQKNASDLFHNPSELQNWLGIMDRFGIIQSFDALIKREDGDPFWARLSSYVVREELGRGGYYEGSVEDVSGRKHAMDALEESEQRFRAIVEQARDGISVGTPDGRMILYNKAMEAITGYTLEEVNKEGWFKLCFPNPPERQTAVRMAERARDGHIASAPFQILRRDGSLAWVSYSQAPISIGGTRYYLSIATDITERKHQEEQIDFLTTHDALTGLPNRRVLEEVLRIVVSTARQGRPAALLFMDVDNFRVVNDSLGHPIGDQLLIALSSILRDQLRQVDLLVRLGGDEFAALLPETDLEEAWRIGEKLRKAVDEHRFTFGRHNFNLGLSVGLVVINGQHEPSVVLSLGDATMYRAKQLGRNRLVLCEPDLDDPASLSQANQLVVRLKDALRTDDYVLHFQPIVRLDTTRVEHFEALVRLKGENGKLIPPLAFIPAAERYGLMPKLTRWIVSNVVQILAQDQTLTIFVNLSAQCIADSTLPIFVEECLREGNVSARRLGFEITETTLVQDLGNAERWVRKVRELGCPFALDDFGAGFSSFAYLKSLPVDYIKIDGSLVRTIATDSTQRALVQAIQTLAMTMGKEVVAEYVENEAIAEVLREIGVALGQGYHFGKPKPF